MDQLQRSLEHLRRSGDARRLRGRETEQGQEVAGRFGFRGVEEFPLCLVDGAVHIADGLEDGIFYKLVAFAVVKRD